ncbi:hypothetical protein BHQ21_14245 [Mycobacterium sherrisii]|uniref:ER-bound oxygenase mpaB/mpaB'/Rubber oxygenase catalytic domain-containing protein n=1 Tax=Mycobacterium sherrisii TaxID=243061 RepID=A0A1E3ST77_9MYCO|nr:hypothetical protein BHQ21_14245 [Mycobacterium sherrisii]
MLETHGVGYGVLESPVDSGNVYQHPFQRARTTGTYLAVATIGTAADRKLIREAVAVAHRQVRSAPSSPGVLQRGVAALAFLPWPLRALAGPLNLFATTGFLAPEFRALMRLDWSRAQQRRFEWLLSTLRLADQLIPHRAWLFGYQIYLWDTRFRARRGRRIV